MRCDSGPATLAPAGTSQLSSDLHRTLWHQARGEGFALRKLKYTRKDRMEACDVYEECPSPACCHLYSTMGL